MEVAETQPVTEENSVKASQDIMAQALGFASAPKAPAPEPIPVQTASQDPVAEQALAEVVAEVKEAPKAEEVKEVVTDPYELAVGDEPVKEAVTWNDDSLKVFKSYFGDKDPQAFKEEVETIRTQAELTKAELDKLLPLNAKMNALTPAEQHALGLMLQGKSKEAQDYMRAIPEAVFQNKEAKDIPTEKLIKSYFPDKVSDEQFAMLTDPDADPDVVDALKTRLKILRDAATDVHEAKRAEANTINERTAADQRAAYEKFQLDTAASIAHAKTTPMKAFLTPEVTSDIQTGNFIRKFVQEDGVTPTPEATVFI